MRQRSPITHLWRYLPFCCVATGLVVLLVWAQLPPLPPIAVRNNYALQSDLRSLSAALVEYTNDRCGGVVPYVSSRNLPPGLPIDLSGRNPLKVRNEIVNRKWVYQTSPGAVGKPLSSLDPWKAPLIEVYGGPDPQWCYAVSWGGEMMAPRYTFRLGPNDEADITNDLKLLLNAFESYVKRSCGGVVRYVSSSSLPKEMRVSLQPAPLRAILGRTWTYQTAPASLGKALNSIPAGEPLLEVFEGPQGLPLGGISPSGQILLAPRGDFFDRPGTDG